MVGMGTQAVEEGRTKTKEIDNMTKCSRCAKLGKTQCSEGGFISTCSSYSGAKRHDHGGDSVVTAVVRNEMQECFMINTWEKEQIEFLDSELCIDAEREGIYTDCTRCDMLLACAIVMAEARDENKTRFQPRPNYNDAMWKFSDCQSFVTRFSDADRHGCYHDPEDIDPIEGVCFKYSSSVPQLTPREKGGSR